MSNKRLKTKKQDGENRSNKQTHACVKLRPRIQYVLLCDILKYSTACIWGLCLVWLASRLILLFLSFFALLSRCIQPQLTQRDQIICLNWKNVMLCVFSFTISFSFFFLLRRLDFYINQVLSRVKVRQSMDHLAPCSWKI